MDHTVTRVSRNIRDMSRITSIQQQTLLEAAVRFGLHMLSQLSQDALDRVSDSITLHDGETDTTLALSILASQVAMWARRCGLRDIPQED